MKQSRYFKTLDEASAFATGLAHANEGHIHSIHAEVNRFDPNPRFPYVVNWINEARKPSELPEKHPPMTSQEYVSHKGTLCPVCCGDDLEGRDINIDKAEATQLMFCLNCEASWNDCYELSGYDDLER